MREKLTELKIERNSLRDRLHKAIEEAKSNNEKIKEFRGALKGSRENFLERIEDLEQRLVTAANLTKDDERNINNEITTLKRSLKTAQSSGDIEMRL